jgi:hypothetical protein
VALILYWFKIFKILGVLSWGPSSNVKAICFEFIHDVITSDLTKCNKLMIII